MIKTKEEFINYFELKIRPKYKADVSEGNKVIKKLYIGLITGFLVEVIIFMILSFVLSLLFGSFGVFLAFPISIFFWIFLTRKNSKIKNFFIKYKSLMEQKNEIFNEIIGAIIPGFQYGLQKAITKNEFEKYSFVSTVLIDHFKSEDAFYGNINNKKVRISECRIQKERKHNDVTDYEDIFNGIVTELEINLESSFKLIITKKKYLSKAETLQNWINNIGSKEDEKDTKLEKISMSNIYLDEHYTILTNDSIKANKLLDPRNLERLTNIMEKEKASISIGIFDGKIIILMENKTNMFEIFQAGRFEPETIWDEIHRAFESIKIIEELKLDFKKL